MTAPRKPGATQLASVLTALLTLGAVCTHAAPVFFDSGVDSHFLQLPGGSPDPHYQLRQVVAGTYVGNTNWSPAVAMQSAIAWPQWVQPGDARWIYIADAANPGQDWGTYEYMTTFDLTGFDPSTALLSGKWAVDQYGTVYLNGTQVASLPDGNWNNNLTSFNLTSGFVAGTNTLTFYVRHPDGGDGMIVSGASLSATALSTPSFSLSSPGLQTNGLGFSISCSSTSMVAVVIEACTNVASPVWVPLDTNSFSGGLLQFTDTHWTNYSSRFYRVHWR